MIRLYYFLLPVLTYFSTVAQEIEAPIDHTYSIQQVLPESFQKLIDSSNTYYFEGNYKKSLEVNILLLKKALAANDSYNIHRGYRHLGYDYLAMNDTLLAEENFEKSERFAKISKNDTATAVTYMDLANLYSVLKNDHKTALVYHDKSISLFKQIKDSAGLAKAHYNTIITALKAEEYSKAFLHLIKAKKLRDFNNHVSYNIGIESLFGEYYLAKQNYEMADIYLTRAIEAAERENLGVELRSIYESYSESLFLQGRYAEAYEARKKYEIYFEEDLQNMISAKVEVVSTKFQVAEYRKDIQAAELKNELQAKIVTSKNRLNIILIVFSICALILFLAFLFAFRKRKKLVHLLRQKNLEYLKAKKQTEKLAKAKSKFFSTVSHELRTPLYGVIGMSTILLENEALKNHKEDLKSLKFSADYLMALINDLLLINKIDSTNLEDESSAFDLKELFESISTSFEYMKDQNNNKIQIIISEDVPKLLKGNSILLSQLLMNLVGNACKFTENGTIYIKAVPITASPNRTTIKFSVQDTGIGIARDKFSEIFDEFSQLESNKYNYQGTGLGLPIVKKLLDQSNSDITLQSELGKGSTFSFNLSYEVLQESKKQEEVTSFNTNLLKDKKVLIVEDNRINQIVTKRILEKKGVICTIAENGIEAVRFANKERYDLILMDLNMPLKNGFEATQEIRTFDRSIPILALTAVEIEEVRNEIYQTGMNDIIVKPYDVTKFIQTILKNINEKGIALVSGKDRKAM